MSDRDEQTQDQASEQATDHAGDQPGDEAEDRAERRAEDQAAGLGPMPDPQIEPGDPAPGGVDAVEDGPHAGPATPDLSLVDNPAVDHVALPDEMQSGEDTSTQATRSEEPMSGEQESPA